MPVLTRSALIGRPPEVVYGLVADVRAYPQFVPGCADAQVLSDTGDEVVARLKVRKGPLATHLATRNRMVPHSAIHMALVEGPLRSLHGGWHITPVGEGGCRLELRLDYEFESAFKAAIFQPLIEGTVGAMVQAFVARARQAG